ncbi:MAG: DUF1957 domain-containing protein [Treponemataceae bacterium]|nr:DUF1957 domain-containing protein [Treponemataceae bacterium]
MSKKSLVINIVFHNPYIRHIDGDNVSKNSVLFTAISDVYLPILNMFADLEAEGIPFKVNMVISPVLCTMLADPVIQQQYIEWQERIIALGEAETSKYKSDDPRHDLAVNYLEKAKQNLKDFQETLNQDILSKIKYYVNHGNIELMATAATYSFLPHYVDMPEAVQAQIETGMQIHKSFFGIVPEGFWLPYMGYVPNLESIIRPYGFNYSIVDTHSLLFANPLPKAGIFSPVRCNNSLALFACDYEKNEGYKKAGVYRNQEKDEGFEADEEYLKNTLGDINSRFKTGYKYYSNEDSVYDMGLAFAQAEHDAEAFLNEKSDKLKEASVLMDGSDVSLVCSFEGSFFGGSWYEGVEWLNQILRKASWNNDLELATCSELIENQYSLPLISPFPGASLGTGYGECLLDSSNSWMIRYVRKACERMIDLSVRFSDDSGLKARSLNLAAKEVLLAMAGDWPMMLHDGDMPEYAEERFKESVSAFSTVYDSLGSNSISTEWLTRMERNHPLFDIMNYHVFSRRK